MRKKHNDQELSQKYQVEDEKIRTKLEIAEMNREKHLQDSLHHRTLYRINSPNQDVDTKIRGGYLSRSTTAKN